MKKQLLLLVTASLFMIARSQTGVQLVAMTQYDALGAGSIIQYNGGDTVLNAIDSFQSDPPAEGGYFQHLTLAPNGKLYGLYGGDAVGNMGTLYEYIYATNTYIPKVTFDSATGDGTLASLLIAKNGLMYGVTGAGDSTNGGTIFSYVPGDTAVTKLVTLPANANSACALIEPTTNHLFGLTNGDGANFGGTIFEYNIITNAYTVLLSLPGSANPVGRLLQAGKDTLYGTTMFDGENSSGTLFRYIVGQATDTVLFTFPDGAYPSSSLIQATDGQIYGLTYSDGSNDAGTIFRYNIDSGTYAVLYNFGTSLSDAASPWGGLLEATDSILYGMTNGGGVNNVGAIFSYNITTSTYTKLVDLGPATGDGPGYGSMTEFLLPPVLVKTPASAVACPGDSISFTATATGLRLKEIWQLSTNGGTSFANISGATDTTFTVLATSALNSYLYRAVIYNGAGYDTTAAATLVVTSINDTATVTGAICTAPQTGASYQWLTCSSGQPISGATSQVYVATANGDYSCLIMIGSCADTTNCVTVAGLGITDINNYSFNLFPNPTNGTFVISNDYPGVMKVRVMSVIGDELKAFNLSGNQGKLDISDLSSGIYEVLIEDGNQVLKVLKVVKE